jgi:hypothetical protein
MLVGIFGTGRNGSSLFSRLIDGIPNTYVHPLETIFFSAINDLTSGKKVLKKNTIHNAVFTKNIFYNKRFIINEEISNYYQSQVSDILEQFELNFLDSEKRSNNLKLTEHFRGEYEIQEFINDFMDRFSEWLYNGEIKENKIFRSVELIYLDLYEQYFPDMKFIHLLRDPVKTYESIVRETRQKKNPLKRSNWYLGGDTLFTILKRWEIHTDFLINKIKNKNNHLIIKYEDLVMDPSKEINKVSEWLNFGVHPLPNILSVFGDTKINKLPKNVGKTDEATPLKVISDTSKKYNYEKSISLAETYLIKFYLHDNAYFFDYVNKNDKPNKFQILKLWAFPKNFEFLHLNSALKYIYGIYKILERRTKIVLRVLK